MGAAADWVEDEAESVSRYRRLAESAELHAGGAAGLMTDPELSNMLAWRDREKPNVAWAERYDPQFERALTFLEMSARTRDEEEIQGRRARRRKRLLPIVGLAAAVIFAVLAAFTVFAVNQRNTANQLRRSAERRDGVVLAAVRVQNAARVAQGTLNGYLACKDPSSGTGTCPSNLDNAIRHMTQRVARLTKNGESGSAAIAAIAVGGNLISANSIRRNDLFDVSRGAGDFHTSGYNGPAMFGLTAGNNGVVDDFAGGHPLVTFFSDGKPAGYRHWVEWKTRNVVNLRSVGLFARHDGVIAKGFGRGGFLFRRAFKAFELDARQGGRWVTIVRYEPTLPYAGGSDASFLAVCLPVRQVSAREFRAVFVQAVNILDQFSGPRIVALDGNAKSCAAQYPAH